MSSLVPEKEEKRDRIIDRRDGGDRKDTHGGVSLDARSSCHEPVNFTISTCLGAVAGKFCAVLCILHEFEQGFQLVFARAGERREKLSDY